MLAKMLHAFQSTKLMMSTTNRLAIRIRAGLISIDYFCTTQNRNPPGSTRTTKSSSGASRA
jgi:hypothetical protein